MRLIANNDGTWSAHDETYDIIIRCGTKEENERVMELLKNEPISKKRRFGNHQRNWRKRSMVELLFCMLRSGR